jgi:hypothetical protein
MNLFKLALFAGFVLPACSGDAGGRAGPEGSSGSSPIPGAGNGPIGGNGPNPGTGGTGSGNPQGGTPGNGGTPSVGFSLDCDSGAKTGRPVLRLLTRGEFDNTLSDVFPSIKGKWTNSLPATPAAGTGFDNDSSAVVGNQLASALLETAQSIATAVTGDALPGLLSCAADANAACAEKFLVQYGARLFRRPLNDAERSKYLTYFNSALGKSDFKTALKWMTVGLIQSPHAMYRSELGTVDGGKRRLTPHEIATELAYTYTGTTPSEALLTMAEGKNLGDLVGVAKSLLAGDPEKRVLHRFFESYANYPLVVSKVKPGAPDFGKVSPDMVKETRTFIDDVLFNKGGGIKELLTSPNTFPSKQLATYYGLAAPATDYASVPRKAGEGIGLLAQGAFLATHANTDASSPTQRGLFVYYRLLCQDHLIVPAGVPPLSKAAQTNTTRERYEIAHATGGCAGCHKKFDPIGFGFEHYDEAGRYRAMEKSFPINSTGAVLGPDGNELFKFTSQEELVKGLADQPILYQCLSAYLATYAFGTTDACLGPSQVGAMQSGTMGIAEAYAELAGEPHFTERSTQ